jgi:anti-anti-sigma regulatory factor
MLLLIVAVGVVGIAIGIITAGATDPRVTITSYAIVIVTMIVALWILRRGQFRSAAMLATIVLISTIGIAFLASGFSGSSMSMLSFTVPIVIGGLTLGRRGVLAGTGLAIGWVALAVARELSGSPWIGFAGVDDQTPQLVLVTFVVIILSLALVLDRFSGSLREALRLAQAREHDLERLRDSLEQEVAERTSALQAALRDVEQREARLSEAFADLQAAKDTVRDLTSPVIPILEGVLVAPLIGTLDERRAEELSESLLHAVEREHARHVILDVTGMPLVDTQVAQSIIRTAEAVRLLGARALLAGIRPEVAQTLVSLGVDLSNMPAYAGLREAVAVLASEQLRARA